MMEVLYWEVPADHPALPGHFPGNPIVPGVVLLDQACCLLQQAFPGVRLAGRKLSSAKFFNPVGPGERLSFRIEEKAGGALAVSIDAADRPVATLALSAP